MKASKGFTLIELAVVIAIVAVLAAVAVPRFGNLTRSANIAVARDFQNNLLSAVASYTATNLAQPTGFNNFVTTTSTVAAPFTITTFGVGNGTACTVAAATLTCANTFGTDVGTVTYSFNGGAPTYNGPTS